MPDEIKTDTTGTTSLLATIRPTPLERLAGRIMRAPDHDSGTDASGGGDDAAADQGGDKGGDDAGGSGDDAAGDATILGSADAGDGAGDDQGDDAAGDAGADDGDDDAAGDADGPPEAYDIKLTLKGEDGKDADVPIDAALLEAATPVFKEAGLSNDQAQKLAPLVLKVQERMVEQQNDAFAATRADWAKETTNDPDIGGKHLKETKALAAKALDHFVGPAVTKGEDGKEVKNPFRQLLDDTGLGDHPDMVRAFRKIGAAISEDGTFPRSEAKAVKQSREEVLYPDDVPTKKK